MNIITAAKTEKQSREALLGTYSDHHVSDYTAAALTYSDHRARALWVVALLLGFAAVGVALYNMIRSYNGNASIALFALALVLFLASLAVHKFRGGTDRATIMTINTTVTVARDTRGPGRI